MFYRLRIILLLLIDCILVNLALFLALFLRFGFEDAIPDQYMQAYIHLIPWWTVLAIGSIYLFRLYHRMWQYASLGELYGIVKAASSGMLVLVLLIYTMPLPHLPRSVYILGWMMTIILVGGSRLTWRVMRDSIVREAGQQQKSVLIVGAGDAGALLARELLHNRLLNLNPIGFVDDSRLKQKLTIYGIPVLGTRDRIPHLVKHYQVEEILIAMPSADGRAIREILEICRQTLARVRVFQGPNALFQSRELIRDIQVEDLLRREPVQLNLEEISSYLGNKVVLVTGAGGSIGSELCRQLCGCGPKRLILLDYSENNLFEIERELRSQFLELDFYAALTDIRDRPKLEALFADQQPQVIFHAAAYKHVPLMETNPDEAVKNNVVGTHNVARLADQYGSEVFVLISTDKAVNPSSIMGATKRIAELIIQEMGQHSPTCFAAVRFGNVLGSRGSVIPIFEQQIAQGGPVTVTHPDMTRYFMTIPEAAQLVIQAGALARGGEIFVLDMGQPVKILDLAKDLISLHGSRPDQDIPIVFTGIRPGEKLSEELFNSKEGTTTTRHDRIFISNSEAGGDTSILGLLNRCIDNEGLTIERARFLISSLMGQGDNLVTRPKQKVGLGS